MKAIPCDELARSIFIKVLCKQLSHNVRKCSRYHERSDSQRSITMESTAVRKSPTPNLCRSRRSVKGLTKTWVGVVAIFFLILILFPSLVTSIWADDTGRLMAVEEARQQFVSRCPKPQWWDRVSVSDVNIKTYDDLLNYWQNKNRSKSQFFKAAYKAILDYPLDDDIVVNAINLMHYTYSYQNRIELQEYAIGKNFVYRNPYGKPANTIASIVRNLGQLYNDASRFNKSVNLIERLLKEREAEINDHSLELIHLTYAEALQGQSRTTEAINILKKAVKKYNGSWEKRLDEAIARYERRAPTISANSSTPKEHVPKQAKPWWTNNIVTIGGFLLVILFIGILRARSEQKIRQPERYPSYSAGTDSDVERLVIQGRKIEAIKLYRQIHNVGLEESKRAIDQIAKTVGKTRW